MKHINIQYYKTRIGELILGSFDGRLCLLDFRDRKMRTFVLTGNIEGRKSMRIIQYHHFWPSVSMLLVIILSLLLMIYSTNILSDTGLVDRRADVSKNDLQEAMPFITVRNKTGSKNAAQFYGGERSSVSAGYCQHTKTSLDTFKPIIKNIPFYIPEDIVTLDSLTEIEVEELWKNMKRLQNGRHPTFYTHGFNIDFEKGCRRVALFQKSYGLKDQFLFFSWPSDGNILNYTHDEADVYWSVAPMRQMLSNMLVHFGEGNINVVAHSLGARGVFLAFVLMAQAGHADKPLFNQVVFIAPDIDAGIFEQYLPLIRPLAKNITVYVSANDSPLMLSRQVHGYPRLGEPGEHLDGLTGIEIIDVSDISMRSPSGHLYHLHHATVINDLAQLLNENELASKRNNLEQVSKKYWKLR